MPTLSRCALAALLLSAPALSLAAATAFERAERTADGRVQVESLLIGCSTDAACQKEMARFLPRGHHRHAAGEWVSFDQDPAVKPDIQDSVVNLEQHIAAITGKVYVEHFNDTFTPGGPRSIYGTYLPELMRKLFRLMRPGATLHADLYIGFGFGDRNPYEPQFVNCENSPWGVDPATGVDSARNPFWVSANFNHFSTAVQAGSEFDTFGGRFEVIAEIVRQYRGDAKLMATLPARLDSPLAVVNHLTELANERLAELLEARDVDRLSRYARIFYGFRQADLILAFMREAGFQDVRLVFHSVNPFNGRQGECMIVAVKGEEAPAALERKGDVKAAADGAGTQSDAKASAGAAEPMGGPKAAAGKVETKGDTKAGAGAVETRGETKAGGAADRTRRKPAGAA